MTAAIGVDLIEVERIRDSVERFGERFLRRVFTDAERAYCQGRAPELAARWAAKEAVAKALGTGIGVVQWREIEVMRAPSGAPSLRLHGRAAELAQEQQLGSSLLSIAHTHEHAIAFVVWEGAP